ERNPFVVIPVELGGYRTSLAVPMLKDNELIGAITINRAGQELRGSGRRRHREHPPAERAAPAHERLDRSTRAADRDLGGAACYFELAGRARAGVFSNAGKCHAHLRGQLRKSIPS